ncbi:HET-domain-containing protein [Ophiobolus disseminans]|uniref:HET-domain-containing protein n=1 Tax=Ophiobolus disseminans TaxID=1469910 RepID=A0A6A6ZHJ9_9PLEO|nr:HET-domain-containing protein [Ophiobolus disseminans]
MSLCPACSRISVPALTRALDDPPPWIGLGSESNKLRGMVHLDDARHLIASASAGCPFCHLIVDAVLQYNNFVYISSDICDSPIGKSREDPHELDVTYPLAPRPIYLQTNYDPVKPGFPEDGIPGSWHIRGVKVHVPCGEHGVLFGRIRLYAARDSLAGVSCDIIGRPPLSSSDSPEAFDLIQRWMGACLAKHAVCKESLSGAVMDESTPPILPTRVIRVGSSDGEPSPQLLETNGMRGHYTALSHCWGPPSHRPLMTTQSLLADHLNGIAWNDIPQSYQDAISATRRLGFEYIWIDSLCIIQDSHTDWLSESQRMGDVYQRARLTIAASHTPDSSHSCFFTRPPLPPAVTLPHVTADEYTEGVIFASLVSKDYDFISPESGALADRAWATQEWLLSRRMVFYTEGSLVWSCKTVSQRETGASFHSTARNARWKNLVEKYSARQLTQQTDRLVALEGIRSEMAVKRGNDEYCQGLWKNSMPDQLLWCCLSIAERAKCQLALPSWTWASTLPGVRYLDMFGAKNACEHIRFDITSQTLSLLARVRIISRIIPHDHTGSLSFLLVAARPRAPARVPTAMRFCLHDHTSLLGWCVLDEGVVPEGEVYCLRLMASVVKNPRQGVGRMYHAWILMLRCIDAATNMFTRVGVGAIESPDYEWFGNCTSATIRIC